MLNAKEIVATDQEFAAFAMRGSDNQEIDWFLD